MNRLLPLVDLRGDAREIGVQHGRAAKAHVAHNVDAYRRRFTEWGHIPRDEVRLRAEAYRQVIEDASPDYAAAMEGIAEGAGQDVLDIVAINVRYEMMYSEFAERGKRRLAGPLAGGGCTSFALLPQFTASGHLIIGQNWDWVPESQGLLVRTHGHGPDQLAFTEAGIVGAKIGLNDAGIGLAINGLVSDRDSWSPPRVPFHVRCAQILAARSLRDAQGAITEKKRSCSANFLIAQGGNSGAIVDVEAAPDNECVLLPTRGYLVHTNHFLDPDALGIWQPLAEDRPSTMTRFARIHDVMRSWEAKNRSVSVEDLKRILRNHTGAPNSLCRHPDVSLPSDDRYETVVSVIMDLDAKEMYVASGTPCTARYRLFPLSGAPA